MATQAKTAPRRRGAGNSHAASAAVFPPSSASPLPAIHASSSSSPRASSASASSSLDKTQPLTPKSIANTQILKLGQEQKQEEVRAVPIRSRLDPLASRFDGFEDELNLSRNRKKVEQDARFHHLQVQINNLQQSLTLESNNRAMSVKALQNWLTDRIAQWTQAIEAPITARLASLADQVAALNSRIDALAQQQKVDRETFPQLVDARCEELLRDMADLRSRFESAQQAREEKEKKILIKIQAEKDKLTQQLTQAHAISDEKIREVRQEVEEEVAIRRKAHEQMKESVRIELEEIKAKMSAEMRVREEADEQLVAAINHYTAALQDGVKIVSKQ